MGGRNRGTERPERRRLPAMDDEMTSPPKILVVGCGGIGGVVSAALLDQGHDVTVVSTNPSVVDAVAAHGFRTRGEQALGTVPGEVLAAAPKGATFDYVLLATQPPQVEAAARDHLPHLADTGSFVVLQNGLCELRVAAIAGPSHVIGAVVAWGASMTEPGVFDRTSAGGFTIGRIEGGADADVRRLAMLLEAIGPVSTTDNLMGARWSKLAINCAISALGTVGGERLGLLMRRRWVRRLALEVMTEVVDVARAENITLEKVSGTLDLDWLRLTDEEREARLGGAGLVAKHTLLLAVGARYRRLRSSMLRAIERGRPPAVPFLNGEVVERAAHHGLATPVNDALTRAIHRISQGEERPHIDSLRRLFDATRHATVLPSTASQAPSVPASAAPATADAGAATERSLPDDVAIQEMPAHTMRSEVVNVAVESAPPAPEPGSASDGDAAPGAAPSGDPPPSGSSGAGEGSDEGPVRIPPPER